MRENGEIWKLTEEYDGDYDKAYDEIVPKSDEYKIELYNDVESTYNRMIEEINNYDFIGNGTFDITEASDFYNIYGNGWEDTWIYEIDSNNGKEETEFNWKRFIYYDKHTRTEYVISIKLEFSYDLFFDHEELNDWNCYYSSDDKTINCTKNVNKIKNKWCYEYITREKTIQELLDSGLIKQAVDENGNPKIDEDGNPVYVSNDSPKCSDNLEAERCCVNCQKYVQSVVKALSGISDRNFKSYVPYIARVVGSWFRDTYFVIPREKDAAINEYAEGEITPASYIDNDNSETLEGGVQVVQDVPLVKVSHSESVLSNAYGENAQYVEVDKEYLGDTGEYWSMYDTKTNGEDYQLYVLKPNGTTSNTKMEDFLKDGKIDGEPATVFGVEVTDDDNDGYVYSSKKKAEEDGWAFVKKAKTGTFYDNNDEIKEKAGIDDEIASRSDKVLWSTYSFSNKLSTTDWERVTRDDENENVNKLYDIIYGKPKKQDEENHEDEKNLKSGVFFQLAQTHNVTQEEDAERGPTNPLIKYLFKYRKYYIYDGSETRGLIIERDRKRVLYGYTEYRMAYEADSKYYTDKELVEENEFSDNIDFELEKICEENDCKNFYHYRGLLGDSNDGNSGVLYDYYGKGKEDDKSYWKKVVIDLLNNYGRGALRKTYSDSKSTDIDSISNVDLAEQWLEWQLDMFYMNKYGVDLMAYYGITPGTEIDGDTKYKINGEEDLLMLNYDPRDPDLINTVEITKSSLSVFSILENEGSLDADYAYRDFKELIVELDYFDKEELSDKIPEIFTWVLPSKKPAGWPVRAFDKPNIDYGTLIHSKATYNALENYIAGKDENLTLESTGGTTNINGKINESKIYWIGDSWIEGLKASGAAKSDADHFYGLDGKNADDVDVDTLKVPTDVSAFIINFGLNGTNKYTKTQELVDELHEEFSDIPIFVLKTSHVASGYSYNGVTAQSFNSSIDTYNNEMSKWCSGKNYVTFVEEATKTINNGNEMLLDSYKSGQGDNGEFHLNNEGYKAWYKDIISVISNTSNTTTANFEGYEDDEDIVSPVTGKIIKVGKHNRMNLYTSKMEEVEYVEIQVKEVPGDVNSDLNLFYKEYKDVCENYTIMIDGFDVNIDFANPDGKYEKNEVHGLWNTTEKNEREENETKKADAPFLVKYGDSLVDTLLGDGDEYTDSNIESLVGYYVKEGAYLGKTIDSQEILVSNDSEEDSETPSNPEEDKGELDTETSTPTIEENVTDITPTENDEGNLDSEDKAEDKKPDNRSDNLTYTYYDYEGPADYMRIIIKDTDYAIVDNVEDFFEIPDSMIKEKFNGNYSEEMLYYLLVLCEGGFDGCKIIDGKVCVKAFNINDGTVTTAMGVTNNCIGYFNNLGYSEYINGGSGMRVGDYIPIDVVKDVAMAYLDDTVQRINNTFPGKDFDEYQMTALISLMYNFGQNCLSNSLIDAINNDDKTAIESIWKGYSSSAGHNSRRQSELDAYFEKKWTYPYGGGEIGFESETPFTDYLDSLCK